MRYVVGPVADLPPGSSKVVFPEKVKSGIGVFNVNGEFYALKNTCPHMGGPLCVGRVRGTSAAQMPPDCQPEVHWVRHGEIVSCPWHHWEFDIKTGRTIFESRQKVRSYPVSIETADEFERLKAGVETIPVSVEGATVVLDV
jgi:nitrite reductase (NADH) small subunit